MKWKEKIDLWLKDPSIRSIKIGGWERYGDIDDGDLQPIIEIEKFNEPIKVINKKALTLTIEEYRALRCCSYSYTIADLVASALSKIEGSM